MDWDKFLNLSAAISGAFGSGYVMVSIITMSPEFMFGLVQSHWDFSVPQIESIASQKSENIVGFSCVGISFILSIVAAFVPNGKRAFQSQWLPMVIATVGSVGLYVILDCTSRNLSHRVKLDISKVATSRYLDAIIGGEKIDSSSLSLYAQLLELKVVSNESPRSLVHRIAAEVGKTLPPNLDYSAIKQNR